MLYGSDLAIVQHEGYSQPIEALAPALVERLGPVVRGGHVVDVGCGTGVTTAALLAAGARVTAVDPSAPLLAYARARAPSAGFVQASIWDWELPDADALVCFGEPLTYHPLGTDGLAQLARLASQAARRLSARGLWLFDLIVTGLPLSARSWRSAEGWSILVDVSEPAEDRLVRELTTFVREADGRFRRSLERHEVQRFDEVRVRALLEAEGFVVAIEDHLGGSALLPSRRLFVAQKP